MFMVDLAVPRDIEPEVKALQDVYLYTVDDLATVVQTAQASRQAAVEQAEAIIDAGVQSFMHWLDQRDPQHGVVPLIRQIHEQTDQWSAIELARARRRLARGEDVEAVLQALSRGLSRKMLHGTMAELRTGDPQAREATARTASRLFLRSQSKKPL
jgi:glutamyl-tRNA reductase